MRCFDTNPTPGIKSKRTMLSNHNLYWNGWIWGGSTSTSPDFGDQDSVGLYTSPHLQVGIDDLALSIVFVQTLISG